MFELIARLRQRPAAARRRVAFTTALSITLVIALMWVVWLLRGGIAIAPEEEVPAAGTPVEGIWLPLKGIVNDMATYLFHLLDLIKKL